MDKFNLTRSFIKLKQKPQTDREKLTVKTSIVNRVSYSMEDIADLVLESAFNCADATGISNSNWVSQQIFCLDFDSGFTHQDLVNRLSIYGLIPNIIYSTFSDSPQLRKFRVLFILDDIITDIIYARAIIQGLLTIFPEADEACKDPCRMFYPGKDILGINEELNFSNYFESICVSAASKGNVRYYEKFKVEDRQTTHAQPDTINNFDWDANIPMVKILDKFFNEQTRVSYDILLGLATNLQYIKGGLIKMQDRMNTINTLGGGFYIPEGTTRYDTYPSEYFVMVQTIRKWKYLPHMLDSFSPYDEEFHNILSLSKHKRGQVDIISTQDLISLSDGERIMLDTFTKSINSIPFKLEYEKKITVDMFGVTHSLVIPHAHTASVFDNIIIGEDDIYIYKLPTGIGKTQLVETMEECLIALPTHTLKEEISMRMQVDHLVTPRYATYSIQQINDKLRDYQDCDLFSEASDLIKAIALDKCFISGQQQILTDSDIRLANEFMIENTKCRNSRGTVLTTHTRALYDSSFKHKTIIFDEDPLAQLISIQSCPLDFTIFDKTPFESFIKDVELWLRTNLGTGYIGNLPKFNIPTGFREFCATNKRGLVIQLLESKFVFKDAHDVTQVAFCRVNELPKDRRIFIMSATVPVDIYKALYGPRVKVVDITNIEHIGMVEQWTKRSFSMTGMVGKKRYSPKVYEEVFNIISGQPVITHLGARQLFKNNWSKFYFGNCSGGDELNGQDMSVIGTPNKPQYVYLFYAELLGLSNNNDFELSDQLIEWNGFRFRFFTFRNETIRNIQLSLIESELLQACGRNRTLRKYCKTNLFSALPLKITKKFNTN